ncbi:TIR-only protein-like [Macadamia integrifolia]|uniref:TIR-only protein-like n=1 Tax=Macadamia integrifolia TaxID=60698 RepID=UPI001C4F3C54|nr:TIR-only protein-like [Macadamia integrifolia]XP_042489237.1 TIR-only protein-like [Macadamia integrifolia]
MYRSLSKCLGGKIFNSKRHTSTSCRITHRSRLCDVFINHRGMDTKRNIAVLLYDRFVQLELHPFLDYRSMKPGDELLVNIETVIRECKVGVAIFSPNYCTSYFCLHELALMTEYQKKIIPIFYDVNPSDLVVVDDGSYPAKELHRFRLALEHAKGRVGLPFDPSNGDWSDLLKRASDSVVESLMGLDAEEKKCQRQ